MYMKPIQLEAITASKHIDLDEAGAKPEMLPRRFSGMVMEDGNGGEDEFV